MCGVAGSIAINGGRADRSLVARLCEAMQARGPDGEGTWISPDGGTCLGHRRLAVIDPEPRAAQPMRSADGRFVVTFNGEIYNHRTLRAELESDGAQFRTDSDTEVLLELFARHGARAFPRLRGMFAVALFDVRERRLVLARDPYGIKPLYVTTDGDARVAFASSLRAMRVSGAADLQPGPAGVAAFLTFGSVPDDVCWTPGIETVPAGTTLTVEANGQRTTERWSDVGAAFMQAREWIPAADADERIESALADSVRAHLVADLPVGLFLSAGIDSATLLALMHEAGQNAPVAVTLDFAGRERSSESVGAARMARWVAGTDARAATLERADVVQTIPAFFEAMEQPTIDGLNTWLVARAARSAGLKVALSGIGGDELFGGYPSFADIPRWLGIGRRVDRMPGGASLATALARLLCAVLPVSRKLPTLTRHGATLGGAWLARRGLFMPDEVRTLMGESAFDAACETLPALRRPERFAGDVHGDDHLAVAALESTQYLRHQLLRDADWTGMAHSVEVRTPLVDAALLDAVLHARGRRAPRPGKAELWQSPARPMPADLATRPKTGFTVPMSDWVIGTGAGRPRWMDSHWSRSWALDVLRYGFPEALVHVSDRWHACISPATPAPWQTDGV